MTCTRAPRGRPGVSGLALLPALFLTAGLTTCLAVGGAQPPSSQPPVSQTPAARVVVYGVDLTGVGYDEGSPAAPVVLVNFSDFGCPYCATFARETYPALAREFVRTGQVRFKYVPFAVGTFLNGKQAARASECAADQGRFWPMHARLYARQRDWRTTIRAYPVFEAEAAGLGLDRGAFAACYDARRTDRRTEGATALARRLGVRATPTLFVNGRRVEGALPLGEFRAVLREAVAAAVRQAGLRP